MSLTRGGSDTTYDSLPAVERDRKPRPVRFQRIAVQNLECPMAKRRPRRRKGYAITFGFTDGSVVACGPERKPSKKRIAQDGIHICPDGVFREYHYSPTYWHTFKDEERHEICVTLANRLNTRRAIRELVLPELNAIRLSLDAMLKRIDKLEGRRSPARKIGR